MDFHAPIGQRELALARFAGSTKTDFWDFAENYRASEHNRRIERSIVLLAFHALSNRAESGFEKGIPLPPVSVKL